MKYTIELRAVKKTGTSTEILATKTLLETKDEAEAKGAYDLAVNLLEGQIQ